MQQQRNKPPQPAARACNKAPDAPVSARRWGTRSWLAIAAVLLPYLVFAGQDSHRMAHEWPGFAGADLSNQRYSQLTQINAGNVDRLELAWRYQTRAKGSFQAQPVMHDGRLFLTLPGNHLVALDAVTGREVWRYQHRPRRQKLRGGPSNRGATTGHGRVYHATNDGRLLAHDEATGTVLWDQVIVVPTTEDLKDLTPAQQAQVTANIDHLPIKMAPVVFEDMVIVGVTGAGWGLVYDFPHGDQGTSMQPEAFLGRRGFIAAFDAKTGEEAWRWYTTSRGWEGDEAESGPDEAHQAWRYGGGSIWSTPAIDPLQRLLFVGTGNASPNDIPALRPGANVHANSLVALSVDTGELRWAYQQVPADVWGLDVANPPILFELLTSNSRREVVGVAGKTGWFYVHDRASGELLYRSDPFVPQVRLFAAPTPQGVTISPGSFGGANWSPSSLDEGLGRVFIPGIHQPTRYWADAANQHHPGQIVVRYDNDPDADAWGVLAAIDLNRKGRLAWQIKTTSPLVGGVLATAGGLVFYGEGEGLFNAASSTTGESLWQFRVSAGVNAPPVTYQVNKTQFVAVAAGGNRFFNFNSGDLVLAFKLAAQQ